MIRDCFQPIGDEDMNKVSREKIIEELGKDPSEMSVEELLYAISAVSNRLHSSTGEKVYKDTEDVFLRMAENKTKGLSDEYVVDDAVEFLKNLGYKMDEKRRNSEQC